MQPNYLIRNLTINYGTCVMAKSVHFPIAGRLLNGIRSLMWGFGFHLMLPIIIHTVVDYFYIYDHITTRSFPPSHVW